MDLGKSIEEAVVILEELNKESSLPKNIRNKIQEAVSILKSDIELPIKVNKVLSEFEEISDDNNLEPYIRTQIWHVVSILEKINH